MSAAIKDRDKILLSGERVSDCFDSPIYTLHYFNSYHNAERELFKLCVLDESSMTEEQRKDLITEDLRTKKMD